MISAISESCTQNERTSIDEILEPCPISCLVTDPPFADSCDELIGVQEEQYNAQLYREWYKNTDYDDLEASRLHAYVPSIFHRPWPYRRLHEYGSNVRMRVNLGPGLPNVKIDLDKDDAACYMDWYPNLHNTKKSRIRRAYLRIRKCVIEQIDFIKQRDNIWPDKKIYAAFVILERFMKDHEFRYWYLPDSQEQWIVDMLTRSKQFRHLFKRRQVRHVIRWKERWEHRLEKMKLRHRQGSVVNPDYYNWLEKEIDRSQDIFSARLCRIRQKEKERKSRRMDWIEGRTTKWLQRIRPDRRPPEFVEPALPLSTRPPKKNDPKFPLKTLLQIAEGTGFAEAMAQSRSARDPMIHNLDPKTNRVSHTLPKKSGSKEPEDGKAEKRPVSEGTTEKQTTALELADVTEKIRSVEEQRRKLEGQLKELKRKKADITGKPELEQKAEPLVAITAAGQQATAKYAAPRPNRVAMAEAHENARKVAETKYESSLEERSEAIRKKRMKHALPDVEEKAKKRLKAKRWDLQARSILDNVYDGMRLDIDDYFNRTLRERNIE